MIPFRSGSPDGRKGISSKWCSGRITRLPNWPMETSKTLVENPSELCRTQPVDMGTERQTGRTFQVASPPPSSAL